MAPKAKATTKARAAAQRVRDEQLERAKQRFLNAEPRKLRTDGAFELNPHRASRAQHELRLHTYWNLDLEFAPVWPRQVRNEVQILKSHPSKGFAVKF